MHDSRRGMTETFARSSENIRLVFHDHPMVELERDKDRMAAS